MKRGALAALLAAATLLLAGCSMDVDAYLIPPKLQGEEQQIQQALDEFIPVSYTHLPRPMRLRAVAREKSSPRSTARLMTEAEKGDTCWLSCSSVPSKSEIYKVVMV